MSTSNSASLSIPDSLLSVSQTTNVGQVHVYCAITHYFPHNKVQHTCGFFSSKFHCLTELLQSTNITICNFYLTKAYKTVWNEKKPFFITTSIRAEITLLITITFSLTSFLWEIPIRYVISTEYDYTVPGDTYLTGAGAYCDKLGFWYYIQQLESIVKHILRYINKKLSQLISINYLEYTTIILSYNAVLDTLELLKIKLLSDLKVLMKCNNTTTNTWTQKIVTLSARGKRLNRLFYSLLIN